MLCRLTIEAAADAVIEAGFVFEDDRDALLAFADPSRIAAGTVSSDTATLFVRPQPGDGVR